MGGFRRFPNHGYLQIAALGVLLFTKLAWRNVVASFKDYAHILWVFETAAISDFFQRQLGIL
jgi:hypothetical protein